MTATTAPRLQVDNGIKIFHYNGSLYFKKMFDKLYQADWKPQSPDLFGEISELIKSIESLKVDATRVHGTIIYIVYKSIVRMSLGATVRFLCYTWRLCVQTVKQHLRLGIKFRTSNASQIPQWWEPCALGCPYSYVNTVSWIWVSGHFHGWANFFQDKAQNLPMPPRKLCQLTRPHRNRLHIGHLMLRM